MTTEDLYAARKALALIDKYGPMPGYVEAYIAATRATVEEVQWHE